MEISCQFSTLFGFCVLQGGGIFMYLQHLRKDYHKERKQCSLQQKPANINEKIQWLLENPLTEELQYATVIHKLNQHVVK